jgi:TPP-dependent pyruvate/acetoin dehydrogenase alpha subunit
MRKLTESDLIAFENKVADSFNAGRIRAPIHLYSNNETQMISIFNNISPSDWVFCSWRSHYQCLLKGVPEEKLFQAILEGRSIALCFPEHRIFSSAIVAGQVSWAIGVATEIKRKNKLESVWCFLGDMTSEVGISQTAFRYAAQLDLPITFVVEDNGVSVMTDTRKTWGNKPLRFESEENPKVIHYSYKNKYPHAGAGLRVNF